LHIESERQLHCGNSFTRLQASLSLLSLENKLITSKLSQLGGGMKGLEKKRNG